MKKTSMNQVFLSWLVLLLSLIPVSLSAQSGIVITGKVTDNNGEPLPGAAVIVVGQKNTATTADMDGNYQINVNSDAVLVFSSLGYRDQEVPVSRIVTSPGMKLADMEPSVAKFNFSGEDSGRVGKDRRGGDCCFDGGGGESELLCAFDGTDQEEDRLRQNQSNNCANDHK